MTLASALSALCAMLRAQTGAPVILGRPDQRVPGIYVWPWNLDRSLSSAAAPTPLATALDGPTTSANTSQNIHFLLFASPTLTADGLSKLDGARQAIFDHPILNVDGTNAKITLSPLDPRDLAILFVAASMRLTICLSATLAEIP